MTRDSLLDKILVTNPISDLKTRKGWTIKEQVILLKIMDELKPYMEMVKKIDYDNINFYDINVDSIPNSFFFSRKDLVDAGFNSRNFSRDIDEVTDLLLQKNIKTSHPEAINCHESFAKGSWFNTFYYSKKEQKVTVELNKLTLKLLVYFFRYSYLDLTRLINIKSLYAFNMYIAIKMEIDSKKNCKEYIISIDDFRDAFDLQDKYRSVNMLEKRSLSFIKQEINEHTDLNIDYKLIKEGRSYNKIKFFFDYKEKPLLIKQADKNDNLFGFNISNINEDSYFEAILTSWGIRAKEVVRIEESYSLTAINDAIEVTKQAIEDKIIKTTPASFFIGTLENKELQSQVEFEREQLLIREQQEKERKAALLAEYEAIEKFINDNSDEISNYLSIRSGGGLFNLSEHVKEHLENLSCVDMEKFKDFRSKFVVLEQGFWDMKQRKEIRPTMYQFLKLINFYLAV